MSDSPKVACFWRIQHKCSIGGEDFAQLGHRHSGIYPKVSFILWSKKKRTNAFDLIVRSSLQINDLVWFPSLQLITVQLHYPCCLIGSSELWLIILWKRYESLVSVKRISDFSLHIILPKRKSHSQISTTRCSQGCIIVFMSIFNALSSHQSKHLKIKEVLYIR